ncbi:methylated-DNA--[protein]-cysteine S-methyltransferase [Rhodopirellula bahusiensis]|uniref:methylated-DNA--[protein]-cysteine S-methyltransferase n=1 Tax=Rhodopirellula bahusiensis TaxID=2014065 RepID=A0A2G1WCV1_9BACT|nr:methylated-DNA--[protein]-cysteine S-methyltransferase [Rhodopirellula bahusiensis]PHQ36469.1 6-O-methylguanine DNA methyltransferase [Rhodopirellula bahusiensis]
MNPPIAPNVDDSQLIFATGECSLGQVLIAGTSDGNSKTRVSYLALGDDRESLLIDLATAHSNRKRVETKSVFQAELAAAIEFIEQPAEPLRLPVNLFGTDFQKQVWTELAQTEPGETVTYRELADRIGSPGSSRAVGAACGQNQIALAIPCHRAVRSDGKDSGFRWGLDRKRELLRREKKVSGGSVEPANNQLHLAGFETTPAESLSVARTTRTQP